MLPSAFVFQQRPLPIKDMGWKPVVFPTFLVFLNRKRRWKSRKKGKGGGFAKKSTIFKAISRQRKEEQWASIRRRVCSYEYSVRSG